MIKKIKQNWHILFGLLLIIIYLVLIAVQPINSYITSKFDDKLMVEQANSILMGEYLGEYNRLTLVKGILTPLFIAFLSLLKIPFILGQNILYILACIVFVNVIKKVIKQKCALLIIFAILLFNPVMFSNQLCRIYRDGIYTALIIFLVSFVLGIFLNRKEKWKSSIKYFLGLGLTFSAIYICREETIWIIPFLILATLVTILFIIFDKNCKEKIKKICCYSIPIIIFVTIILIICSLNYKYYGVFQLNQYWFKEFKEAYGAMTRVLPNEEISKVPVTMETMERIASVSDKFKIIYPTIEQNSFNWSLVGDGRLFEIQGGWLHWALMEAVDKAGYYETAQKANEFYQELADEINEACDSGELNSLPNKRVSNACRYNWKDIKNVLLSCKDTIKFEYNLKNVDIEVKKTRFINSKSEKETADLFKEISNQKLVSVASYQTTFNQIRLELLKTIKSIYYKINPIVFYISILAYFILLIQFIKKPSNWYQEILILTGLITLYLSRIFVLTFTSELMWTTAVNTMYMSSIYPIQFIFSSLAIIYIFKIPRIKKWCKLIYEKYNKPIKIGKAKNEDKVIIITVSIVTILCVAVIGITILKNRTEQMNTVTIYINSTKIELDENSKNTEIYLETLNSERDTIIKYESGNAKIKINGQQLEKNKELNIGLVEISDDSKIEIEVKYKYGANINYTVNTLPTNFPDYDVEGKSEYDGDYYMSTYSFNYNENHFIFKLDKTGKMKYYKATNKVAFDFKKQTEENGDIKYMYLEATADNFDGLKSILPCDLVIMDENYNEIKRVNYLLEDGTTIPLENHSYIYLGENHYILASYKAKEERATINSETKTLYILDSMIEEVKDGKIIWQFNSTDYPELYEYYTLETLDYSKPYQDYMHINAMAIDEADGNLLCSFRSIDTIIKIDRNTGKIIWKLGGKGDEFGLTDEQKFSKQHSVISIANNTILLYDNGNSKKRSRVLKIKINERDKKIEEYQEYDTELYAFMMGSIRVIDETNQTYLVCYGGGYYTKYSVEEINYSENKVKFKFTFLDNKMLYNANKIK